MTAATIEQAPAVAAVEKLVHQALNERASDIHLEPRLHDLVVRLRIDGHLYDYGTIAPDLKNAVIARLKVLSNINIAEHRIPQDGKFVFDIPDALVDVRVATFPTLHGEKTVLRLLHRNHHIRTLEQLGCEEALYTPLKKALTTAGGFFLVTGPTGAGKTTTLYALLNELNTKQVNIVTLEDPIEYVIEGITQGPVNYDIGFTFDVGLRAVLRQDPDIILVGEIRDRETARVALQAALTGHRVLSTIHTNDAPSALVRLIEMGIEPFLIASALTGIIAQRLVCLLCDACKKREPVSEPLRNYLATKNKNMATTFSAPGCTACRKRGIRGRTGVFELLLMSKALKELVYERASLSDISTQALREGYSPFFEDGLHKLEHGLISQAEFFGLPLA